MMAEDSNNLREALRLARQGRGLASPNPMVGALVCDAAGSPAGRGFYTYHGRKHAEVLALEEAGERARGGTLYVSLEPCCFEGRTPPCTDAIITAGIRRVVCPLEDEHPKVSGGGLAPPRHAGLTVAPPAHLHEDSPRPPARRRVVCPVEDEHPKVSGGGLARLRNAGLTVDPADDFREESRRLNEAFFHFSKTGHPFVTLKAALTLDGKIAAPDDNTGWITSEVARAHVQQVRHDHDAILTGIGTVLSDDPLLTDRSKLLRRRPLVRVVADSLLRISLTSGMVESFNDDLVIATTSAAPAKRRSALEERGIPVKVFEAPRGRVDLPSLVVWLGEQQMISLVIEAGAKLNWAALDSGIVDKTLLYYAPKILGGVDSLPLAGGIGRRSRSGAIQLHDVRTFSVSRDEFAVEAYLGSED